MDNDNLESIPHYRGRALKDIIGKNILNLKNIKISRSMLSLCVTPGGVDLGSINIRKVEILYC